MDLNSLLDQWDQDCVINENKLSEASIDTAKLHSKYIRHLVHAKSKKTKLESDYKVLRKVKFRYYRGELSRQELLDRGWEQYQYAKPLKNEMEEILAGDDDLSLIKQKIEYIDTVIFACESILNQIKARDWQIRNTITWKQFLAGN